MPKLDVHKLIKTLGGPTKIERDIASMGLSSPITVKGIEKWMARGGMKSCWLIILLHLPTLEGKRALDLRKFITT